ncbi:MAG: hypothetical protein JO323_09105 [Acidobacteriia bacterium]|nr:hypothetical protein [Terriglobia bacterium]
MEEDGEKIWRTLRGSLLIGMLDSKQGTPLLGLCTLDSKKWGYEDWFVIEADNGKLVVYQSATGKRKARLQVFENFDAMKGAVPPDIFEQAAKAAGLRPPEKFREVPLEL